jgi:hypothetical protein
VVRGCAGDRRLFFPEMFQQKHRYDGTILITDPCYIVKDKDWHRLLGNDPLHGALQRNIRKVMPSAIVCSTGMGDWDNEIRGSAYITQPCFGADAGLVCVVLERDVLRYNSQFDRRLCAKIVNYHGNVWFDTRVRDWTVVRGDNWHSIEAL